MGREQEVKEKGRGESMDRVRCEVKGDREWRMERVKSEAKGDREWTG